jgi:hypothetical protein
MKKAYSKPDIVFEDFSLSTNIAAGCEEKPFGHSDQCGVKWGKKIIFTLTMTNCGTKIVEGQESGADADEYNKLCYHNPYESYNVFYS